MVPRDSDVEAGESSSRGLPRIRQLPGELDLVARFSVNVMVTALEAGARLALPRAIHECGTPDGPLVAARPVTSRASPRLRSTSGSRDEVVPDSANPVTDAAGRLQG
jgi:hypothetical protein